MSDIADDEFTVLMICAQGESLAAIGRWEKPVDALVERGLLRRGDKFNNFITDAGRKAIADRDREDDKALGGLLEKSFQIGSVQRHIQMFGEKAAQDIAQNARASSLVTGDTPAEAAEKLSQAVLVRALEILKS